MSDAAITITTNGPYLVPGEVPLSRARVTHDSDGVPIAWDVYEQIDTSSEAGADGSYALCRCGASANKPFCDGSHKRINFDGTLNAPEGDYADRAKIYEGPQVVLLDDRQLCEHVGFCGTASTNVWKMTKKTDDDAVRDQLAEMVARCPSGAIALRGSGTPADLDAELPVMIAVTDDGPLFVTGDVAVNAGDEELEPRPRATLCRCGASKLKPYCDASHTDAGFHDAG